MWPKNTLQAEIMRTMKKPAAETCVNENPLIHEGDGEVSLHFNFPTIQSRMRKAEPARLLLDYTRTMMGFLLLQPKPQRIAMIGLGGGSLAKYCRTKLPDADFTAIELSAEVIALRDEFEIPPDGPLFRVICGDGAEYVRGDAEPSDILLIDGFHAEGQPEQLCSAAFYDCCYNKLNEGGVLVVNLCADDTGYGSYVGRIRDSFAEKIVVIEADEGENKIVFAQKGGIFPPGFNEISERLRTLETTHPVDLDRTAQKMLHPGKKRSAGRKRRR
jgi:spermidine synthase